MSAHVTYSNEENPEQGVALSPGFLSCRLILGKRAKGRVSGDIGPIAQHGSNNLVGGWGVAVCLATTD
jgi:hypothetical protein